MAKKATTKKKATSETAPTKKRNLRFVAGQVVKTAGLKKANADSFEITEEMAAELAKLYGEDDLKKCRGVLVLARACIAGYLS